jgi:hypothetical protein
MGGGWALEMHEEAEVDCRRLRGGFRMWTSEALRRLILKLWVVAGAEAGWRSILPQRQLQYILTSFILARKSFIVEDYLTSHC